MKQFTIIDLNKVLNEIFGLSNIIIDTNTTVEELGLDSLDIMCNLIVSRCFIKNTRCSCGTDFCCKKEGLVL